MRTASLLAICALLPPLAIAQLPPTAPSSAVAPKAADGTQAFKADFFKIYNPVTAADMVARVPGFEIRDGDDRRGFGATAGNILVNGERPSSKTIVSEQLKRIPADMVLRLELISGSANSEVSGQSQLVNVVLKKAQATGNPTTFVAGLRYLQYAERLAWTLQASHTYALGDNAELAIDVQAPNVRGRSINFEAVRNAAGALTAYRTQYGQGNNIGLQGAAALKWRPDAQNSVNVNLQYVPTWNSLGNNSIERAPDGVLRSVLAGGSEFDDNYTTELGADWEHRFSPSFSTKLIGLFTSNNVEQSDVFDTYAAPATFLTRTQLRSTNGGERVGRLTSTWRISQNHTLEFGGEGAFNFRETDLNIFNQPRGGARVQVPLAVSKARVEEIRGEAFVTDIWTVNDALTVETGLTFEASRITQTGDQGKEREFSYPKPRITATWAVDSSSQVRASLQRDIAQLDFAEFSSTVDFINAAATQGNPDLVPEKAWKARLEWERRFAERGALTIAVFHDEVQDVHDLVDIAGADAYGNIGDGSRTGIEVKAALPLTFVGLPRAELRFNGLYQNTEVTDPKTGETRSFSVGPERQNSPTSSISLNSGNKDWAYVINFRQELPDLQSAWGAAVVQWAGRREYKRIEVIDYDRDTPRVDLYWETTAIKPLTIRFNLNSALSQSDLRVRSFYQGDRSSGAIVRTETRRSKGGPEGTRSIGVQVSGKF